MTRYINLAEYLVITELATGFAAEDLLTSRRLDLADSALHTPQAGFDDHEQGMLAVAAGEIDEAAFAD